jgi:hypothetical protein
MPSASSSRYQSRLFNFFHQQSRRIGEKLHSSFRHLQVASSWSLEAFLHSVYLLLQKTVESASKQLNPTQPQSRLELEAGIPTTDAPIARVLTTAANLTPKKATSVQGIATEILNRHLVLVTTDNEILDILTPQQQGKLQDRIIQEVANYWRSWRLAEAKDETVLIPEINRLLAKLTGSSEDVPTTGFTESISIPKLYKVLNLLDVAIAKFESNIVPVSKGTLVVQERSWQLIKVVKTQLSLFVYGKQLATNAAEIETQAVDIQALIWDAVNYFFGTGKKKLAQETPITRKHLSTKPVRNLPKLPKSEELEAWLSFGDLFSEPQTENIPSKSIIVVDSSHQTVHLRKPVGLSRKVAVSANHVTPVDNKSKNLSSPHPQNTQVEAQPDWIETKANSVEYEKHPLEKLLGWLDSIMLVLEEIFVSAFQLLQRWWSGR